MSGLQMRHSHYVSNSCYYASIGRAPEAYGSCHVCLYVCVCVILQRAFLHDRNE